MIGTVVNVGAIVIGSTAGALLNKGIKDRYKTTLTQAMGLVAVALGITWIVTNISESTQPMLFIISLVIGGIIGSILNLEERIQKLGEKQSERTTGSGNLIQGLTTAVLLFCVGSMSILGPLEGALKDDHTLLFTKALLDGVTSLILASTFGIGIMISAVVLFLWQGGIYLSAQVVAPFITPEMLGQITIIGGILIFSTGINILQIKKMNTLNLLPALIIPPLYYVPFIYDAVQSIANMLH